MRPSGRPARPQTGQSGKSRKPGSLTIWRSDSVRSAGSGAGLFHQEPRDVVLREIGIAVPAESIVDQPEIGEPIEDLAGEVALEQPVAVATIGNRDRRRIVILDGAQVTAGRSIELVLHSRQL